ncbi:signal recognition particle subunit SRP19 [Methanobrevibacter gottschalkii]|uniref:Signal recognition particle 19 kDa protein n=2 Tax=Methanobrevibacter gottschalkii TaxID=190974 RepID=A0A3N5B3S3_9EURY|nr:MULTISPECIES: signal recognition particle subunit SRP19/SEC65 family protein [Methanobrevibacter]MCQ2970051.1 signal recognition particle subunit SRP19/SEC65 family protein [archaeon]OEC97992.1 signal recognition particle protein Srp19 [Methanobrevibacter sp. A27]RPF51729.1 signal recognition particle subunit SRP19 (srp19) [Methanobrevibacter gottschalkii DSM 11977]SEL02131.1 signal recognition particle subunit SRP19 [Methanobrevibacter gottschalkii]
MITVWPQYLNKKLSLNEGRKISKEDCVKDPTINDIERALKRLGLNYELEKDKSYPGKWYEKSGRALVEWDKSKLELIKEISLKIKEIRN